VFEKIDLTRAVDDRTFEKAMDPLRMRLGELQRELRDRKIPVIIAIEGWNASGITMVISELIQYLDPRGFSLYSIGSPSDDETARPLMWRFWGKIPAKGRISIFARSWYSRALAEEVSGIEWKKGVKRSIVQINKFERQLSDDGYVILKFFLHISKEEQKRRLEARETNLLTSWMITKGDWDFHRNYESYLPVIEQFIGETDSRQAPWTIVAATDHNATILTVYSSLIRSLEKELADSGSPGGGKRGKTEIIKPKKTEVHRKSTASVALTESQYNESLKEHQERVREIQYFLYKRRIPLIIVYEGWDAAGKGGNIMRLVRTMNPRGYNVIPVSRPNDAELEYHYLWRFFRQFPKTGHTTIFDRSWYGRVLVERVENYCSEAEWKRAYNEINEIEGDFVENGGGIVKFWLEVSRDEQLKRFTMREQDPRKQWKITDEDWRNREKSELYDAAIDEMLARTSTAAAPWTIVESDDKWYARIKALKTVISYGERLM
jgi:polyphosphate:AMP phosphotransferase